MTKHFFDIGANAGQTFAYLETLPTSYSDHIFWAFEPSPRHLRHLRVAAMAWSHKYDIRICPFGVGGSIGVRKFFEKDDAMGDSFHEWTASDHSPLNVRSGYDVYGATISLPWFIRQFTAADDEIVLDIDAEGSEYEILGALRMDWQAWPRVREIWVEWHHVKGELPITPRLFQLICDVNKTKLINRGDPALYT